MQVLVTTVGSRGDVEPVAGLARALRELGARVRVCAPPDEEFAALLARAGAELVPLGPPVRSVVGGDKPPTPADALRLARELVDARFAVLAEAAEGCAALLATGLLPVGAREVAEGLGIPYVFACFQLFGLPSRRFPPGSWPGAGAMPSAEAEAEAAAANLAAWDRDAERLNGLYRETLNGHRARLGLAPVGNVRDHVFTDRPWLAADETLCPSRGVTDLEVVPTGAWLLPDERPLPDELVAFLAAGEPPVYVGFGSMAPYVPKDIAQVAVEAVRAQGRRVVLARGWANLTAADDAEDCFVVGEINHQALFAQVAAVIHHGGAGTTTTAARAGVPQVVVPQIGDQPYWASRVATLGIGTPHDGGSPSVESLSAALSAALTPDTRSRAKAVASTITPNGAHNAATRLLETATHRRPTPPPR